jgi:hypothetical protein
MKQFEFRRLDQNCGHSGSKYKANFTDFPANSVNKGIHNNEAQWWPLCRIYVGDREKQIQIAMKLKALRGPKTPRGASSWGWGMGLKILFIPYLGAQRRAKGRMNGNTEKSVFIPLIENFNFLDPYNKLRRSVQGSLQHLSLHSVTWSQLSAWRAP